MKKGVGVSVQCKCVSECTHLFNALILFFSVSSLHFSIPSFFKPQIIITFFKPQILINPNLQVVSLCTLKTNGVFKSKT